MDQFISHKCVLVFSNPLTSALGMFECGQISTVEFNRSPGMCVSQMSQNSQCTRPPRDSVFPLFFFLCEQNCSCEVSVSNHRTVCLCAWCCELQFWEPWSDVTCMRSTCDHAQVPELKGELRFQTHSCNAVHTYLIEADWHARPFNTWAAEQRMRLSEISCRR